MSTKKSMVVYTVRPAEKEGQRDFWTQIGTAFPHPNGEGFNVLLNASPLNGKLVVMPRKEVTHENELNTLLRDTTERELFAIE